MRAYLKIRLLEGGAGKRGKQLNHWGIYMGSGTVKGMWKVRFTCPMLSVKNASEMNIHYSGFELSVKFMKIVIAVFIHGVVCGAKNNSL